MWNTLLRKLGLQPRHEKSSAKHVKKHTENGGNFDGIENLNEIAAPKPVENRNDAPVYRHHTLEEELN